MATPAGAFDTVEAKGLREDLSDVIYNISPTETPFMAMIGRGKAAAIYHEWQTDELAAAVDTNEVIEGDDAAFVRPAATARVGNRVQISTKTIQITGTEEVVDKAGRKSELAYQIAKRGKELKRDIEKQMLSNQASVARTRAIAGRSGTVRAWISTNDNMGAIGVSGGFNTGTNIVDAATNGTQRAFLESDLKTVIANVWTEGGDPSVVLVGAFNKRTMSGFTGNSTRYDRGEDRRLVAAIDVYVSDFGEHRIVPDRFTTDRNAYVLTPRLWSADYLRAFRQFEIAKTGDSEKREMLVEWCLRCCQEKGNGVVADLLTS